MAKSKKAAPQLNYRETRDPTTKGIDQMIAAIPDRGSVKPKARKPPKPRTPPPQVRGGVVVTNGPGVGRVGDADTSGPGLGINTPYITNTQGDLIPANTGSGPGRPGVKAGGAAAGSGPGTLGVMEPKEVPLERVGGGNSVESWGTIADIGWAATISGYTVVPGADAKERMEDDIFQELGWQMRNNWGPTLMPYAAERPFPPFLGNKSNYTFDVFTNQWMPKEGTVRRIGGSF